MNLLLFHHYHQIRLENIEAAVNVYRQLRPGMQLPNGLGQVHTVELSEPYSIGVKASSGEGLDGGEIAGIVIGSVVGGLIGVAVLVGAAAAIAIAYKQKLSQSTQIGSQKSSVLL